MDAEGKDLIALMSMRDLETLIASSSCSKERFAGLLEKAAPPSFSDGGDYVDPRVVWHLLTAVGYGVDDEFMGLGSRPVPPGSSELMVARAMQEATLGDAIRVFAEAANILWPDVHVEARYRLDELHFCMSSKGEYREAEQIFLELACVPFFCIFQWLAGTELPVLRFRTASNRPSGAVHLLAVLDCSVQFDGEGVGIVMPKRVAELATVKRSLADWRSDIYQIFQNILKKRRYSFSASRLQSYVKSALRSGVRSQELIAASAGISVATMRRNLARERTSFRELHDFVFIETAGSLISIGEPVEEIADRMGYADARSFRRAFQRIFGVNPSAYRAQLLSD